MHRRFFHSQWMDLHKNWTIFRTATPLGEMKGIELMTLERESSTCEQWNRLAKRVRMETGVGTGNRARIREVRIDYILTEKRARTRENGKCRGR